MGEMMKHDAMECPLKSDDTLHVLLDYSAGKLDRIRAAQLEQHRFVCAECSAFLAAQIDLWQTLDAWEPEPVAVDFNRRLWQRIDTEAAAPWYRKLADAFGRGVWKPAIPLTAAVLLIGAGFVLDHRSAKPVTPVIETASGVSVIDADQVEKTLDDIQLLGQLDPVAAQPKSSKTM
jgi:hypothetical protein